MISPLLFIIACSLADRARGMKSFMIYPYAAIIAYYATWQQPETNYLATAIIALAIVAGEASGWGNPLGAYLRQDSMPINDAHWWQFNDRLKENTLFALAFRGLMWATPSALSAFYFGAMVLPFLFIAVAFVLAPVIVVKATEKQRPPNTTHYKVPTKIFADKIWAYQEYVRGALIGIGFVLL